jgi:hypothetical protein
MDTLTTDRPQPGRHRAERRARVPGRRVTVAVSFVVTGALTAAVATVGSQQTVEATQLVAADTLVTTTDATPAFPVNRQVEVSRSLERSVVPAKQSQLALESGGQATNVIDLTGKDPRTIAKAMLLKFGFASSQFSCLDTLWTRESHWRVDAHNRTSGAYGIPQALPGSKMASAGSDWRTNPATQITWGLGYIKARYGSPCGALQHSNSVGWY